MKINDTDAAANGPVEEGPITAAPQPRARLTVSSSRLAATAAGAAVAGSKVGLAFFLSRRPTASLDRHHAKFRA
jgi:hypothetical protein